MRLRVFTSVLLLLAGFLLSCSGTAVKPAAEESLMVFPPPPDTTRIQFLKKFSVSEDVAKKASGLMSYVVGDKDGKGIIKPYGVAIHKGRIYVCDTIFAGLEILDLEKKTFEYFQPGGFGKLKKPINCTVDTLGHLYVVDAGRGQVVVFDENLKYQAHFGAGKGSKPTDASVYQGKIFVSDIKNGRIDVYRTDTFEKVGSLPDLQPDEAGFLRQPTNLVVTDGLIYVSDFGDFNIKIYTLEGEYVRSIGSYGRGLGQFVRPKGIAVDKQKNLYVVDAAFENVQIFDANGRLLMFFGGKYRAPGNMWLPAKVIIDYDNLKYFQKYVYPGFDLKYLILVTNQYGPDKISVYGYIGPEMATPDEETLSRKD